MLIYPEYPNPDAPIKLEFKYNMLKSNLSFNFSYKRRLSFRRKKAFVLNYSYLTKEEVSILHKFYHNVMMNDGNFYYITHTKYDLENEYLDKYIGQTGFYLPINNFEKIELYLNYATNITSICEFIYEYPRYKIIVNTNLQLGDIITFDVKNANLCVLCEFDSTSIGLEHLTAGLNNIKELKLVEVFNV